jgi:transposase
MQDRGLYQEILGFEDASRVEYVELLLDFGEIPVRISHPSETKFCCKECLRELACYDHGLTHICSNLTPRKKVVRATGQSH